MSRHMTRTLRALPWIALGPVTAPLAWRMFHWLRLGNRTLAGMYAIAIVSVWVVLSVTGGQALADLAR